MLLGLTGYKGSGKDTVGAYLVKEHGFERRSFADKLKESAAALFDVEPWQFDEWKRNPDMVVEIIEETSSDRSKMTFMGVGVSVRQFLQNYGTEAHRDIFGENFWVDQVLPVGGFYAGRAIAVTDCRFRNEMDRVLDLGGHIVYIDRPALGLKDPHRSEVEIDYGNAVGIHLKNDKGVLELYGEIERMLDNLG